MLYCFMLYLVFINIHTHNILYSYACHLFNNFVHALTMLLLYLRVYSKVCYVTSSSKYLVYCLLHYYEGIINYLVSSLVIYTS